MSKTEIEAELRGAGADSISFEYSYGHLVGIVVTVGDKRHGAGWNEDEDQSATVVEYLKQWLAENR